MTSPALLRRRDLHGGDGNTKLTSSLVKHYRVPTDFDAWVWAMQLNQVNALRCALEWFRANVNEWAGALRFEVRGFDGAVRESAGQDAVVPARTQTRCLHLGVSADDTPP